MLSSVITPSAPLSYPMKRFPLLFCLLAALFSPADAPASSEISKLSSELPAPALSAAHLATAPGARFVLASGEAAPATLHLEVTRDGELLRYTARNTGAAPVAIREIILADLPHGLPPETALYAEGMNMFSSTGGTLGSPRDLDVLTDHGHYRLPVPAGYRSAYNYLLLTPPSSPPLLVGFASCHRFHGKLNFNPTRLQLTLLAEDLVLPPGASWPLETLFVASGESEISNLKSEITAPRATPALFDRFATHLLAAHPRLAWPAQPTGWCSWYAYWQDISAEIILRNLDALRTHAPALRYIQIDDGYQPWMGDWLDSTDKFAGGVRPVIDAIRAAGFEPAIWVAPFIASPESRLFREHPEWFVRDSAGRPLPADTVTFGGWRQGPWYMLDGTHPEARAHLEHVFRTLRSWGVTYFKLDANLWGTLPYGRRHDPAATSVQAYRLGMAAVRRGAGPDALLLGCNHGYWPSLGEIHASRTSYDINRSWEYFTRVARQNLSRNWMNDRLWWNDPDCLLIPDVVPAPAAPSGFAPGENTTPPGATPPKVTVEHFSFHAAATYATGGMLLSGDRVADYTPAQWQILRRAFARPPLAARFADDRLDVGVIDEPARRVVILLNWSDTAPATLRVPVSERFGSTPVIVSDFWTQAPVVTAPAADDPTLTLPPASGRVLLLEPQP